MPIMVAPVLEGSGLLDGRLRIERRTKSTRQILRLAGAPDRDLGHALAVGRRLAHDLAHSLRVDMAGLWRCATKARRQLRACAAYGANRAPNRLDARCQGFSVAFTTDVHEVHLGRVVEEVIVQSGHA